MISIKTKEEQEKIVASGKILGKLLKELSLRAKAGVNLLDLDAYARDYAKKNNAVPAFLNYKPEGAHRPYPAAICTSLNEVVVHGVPRNYTLKSGDVLKLDAGIIYDGMYSDSAVTVPIGRISPKVRSLIKATYSALDDAIAVARAGNTIGDIGWAIERRARHANVKVLRALTGHGVGYELHEDPPVYNYGKRGTGMQLREGMVLAIEPMFSLGSEDIIQKRDESYASADGSMTAHAEHTIIITKSKPIIATKQ